MPSEFGIGNVTAGTLDLKTVMIRLFEICNIEFEARLVGEGIFNEIPTDILMYRKFLS